MQLYAYCHADLSDGAKHALSEDWLIIMTNTTHPTLIIYYIRGDWMFVFIHSYDPVCKHVCDTVGWGDYSSSKTSECLCMQMIVYSF